MGRPRTRSNAKRRTTAPSTPNPPRKAKAKNKVRSSVSPSSSSSPPPRDSRRKPTVSSSSSSKSTQTRPRPHSRPRVFSQSPDISSDADEQNDDEGEEDDDDYEDAQDSIDEDDGEGEEGEGNEENDENEDEDDFYEADGEGSEVGEDDEDVSEYEEESDDEEWDGEADKHSEGDASAEGQAREEEDGEADNCSEGDASAEGQAREGAKARDEQRARDKTSVKKDGPTRHFNRKIDALRYKLQVEDWHIVPKAQSSILSGAWKAITTSKIGAYATSLAKTVKTGWISLTQRRFAQERYGRSMRRRREREAKKAAEKAATAAVEDARRAAREKNAAARQASVQAQEPEPIELKTDASKKKKQRATKNKAKKTTKPRQHYPRGEPDRGVTGTQWSRAVRFLKSLIRKPPKGVTKAPDWLANLPAKVIDAAAEQALELATPLAKDLLKIFDSGDLSPLQSAKFWTARRKEALNQVMTDAKAGKLNRKHARGGVYLGVILENGKVLGIYDGRTRNMVMRYTEHMANIMFGTTKCDWHRAGRGDGREVLVFALYLEDETEYGSDEVATHRAIIEALYCILFGTYCKSKPFLEMRRRHGLLNIGDGIRGLNGTRCFEKPEKATPLTHDAHGNDWHISTDPDITGIHHRLSVYWIRKMAAAGKGQSTTFMRFSMLIEAAQHALSNLLAPVFIEKGVLIQLDPKQYVKKNRKGCITLICGVNVTEEDVVKLEKVAPNGKFRLFLRESSPQSSLSCLSEAERPYYGGLAIVAVSDEDPRRELVFTWPQAPLTMSLRKFFNRMVTLLPTTSREARTRAKEKAIERIIKRRPAHFDKCSRTLQWFIDGQFFLTSDGEIKLDDRLVPTWPKDQPSRPTKTGKSCSAALKRVSGMLESSNPFANCWAIPIRIVIESEGEGGKDKDGRKEGVLPSSLQMSAKPRWRLLILPIGATEWIELPYQIVAGHMISPQHPIWRLRELFMELEKDDMAKDKDSPTPSFFEPFEVNVRRRKSPKSEDDEMSGEVHLQTHHSSFKLTFAYSELKELLGQRWAYPFKPVKLYIHILGKGIKDGKNLGLLVSSDNEHWRPKKTMSSGVSLLPRLFDHIRSRRSQDEKDKQNWDGVVRGCVWEDGVAADDMFFRKEDGYFTSEEGQLLARRAMGNNRKPKTKVAASTAASASRRSSRARKEPVRLAEYSDPQSSEDDVAPPPKRRRSSEPAPHHIHDDTTNTAASPSRRSSRARKEPVRLAEDTSPKDADAASPPKRRRSNGAAPSSDHSHEHTSSNAASAPRRSSRARKPPVRLAEDNDTPPNDGVGASPPKRRRNNEAGPSDDSRRDDAVSVANKSSTKDATSGAKSSARRSTKSAAGQASGEQQALDDDLDFLYGDEDDISALLSNIEDGFIDRDPIPEPTHDCVVRGSITRPLKNGHCGFAVLGAALGLTAFEVRTLIYYSLDPNDPELQEVRARLFPGGVEPEGLARVNFEKWCGPEHYLDHKILMRVPAALQRRIAVIDQETATNSFVYACAGSTDPPIALVYYHSKAHFRGCSVIDEANTLPPEFEAPPVVP